MKDEKIYSTKSGELYLRGNGLYDNHFKFGTIKRGKKNGQDEFVITWMFGGNPHYLKATNGPDAMKEIREMLERMEKRMEERGLNTIARYWRVVKLFQKPSK